MFFIVPIELSDYYVQAFIGSAFALKTLEIIHILFEQVTIVYTCHSYLFFLPIFPFSGDFCTNYVLQLLTYFISTQGQRRPVFH